MEVAVSHFIVTGANGFVGRALCRASLAAGHTVTGLVRRPNGGIGGVREWVETSPDFAGLARAWPRTLQTDCVVHLAARVHVMRDTAADPLAAFRATNVDGALRVAQAAFEHGARRLVFVSSIKALAEQDAGYPLREDDRPQPQDAYGVSKLEAEEALRRFGRERAMEIVVVRPPLVYGPGVRANFLRLMQAVDRGWPLPLGAVEARRSLVYVENLADALLRCATDPRAAGERFHVADDHAPTVAELIRSIGANLNRPARLLPVPPSWLHAVGRVTGRLPEVERVICNLRLDTSRIRDALDWKAPYSFDEGLAETARWYRSLH